MKLDNVKYISKKLRRRESWHFTLKRERLNSLGETTACRPQPLTICEADIPTGHRRHRIEPAGDVGFLGT